MAESRPSAEEEKPKRWSARRKLKFGSENAGKEIKEGVELDGGVVGGDGGVAGGDGGVADKEAEPNILMVVTENVEHFPFEQTQRLKVRRREEGGSRFV